MAALQIRPHSRRLSGLAVLGLTLLAAASFTAGLTRQIGAANAPSPFPAGQEAAPQAAIASPAPAGDFQVAARTPPPRHAAPQDTAAAASVDVEPVAASGAEPLPATDASATAPDQPEPPATPAPSPSQDPPNV
jgi:hypothetical protein